MKSGIMLCTKELRNNFKRYSQIYDNSSQNHLIKMREECPTIEIWVDKLAEYAILEKKTYKEHT